jgi:MOSC domain-containing protein
VHVAELWRYPVKSLAGERLEEAELRMDGIAGDRAVSVVQDGRVVTARIRPLLLGLHGTTAPDGTPLVDGVPWSDPAVLAAVRDATRLPEVELVADGSLERFDVLPLLVATDGAVDAIALDARRFRPNLVIAGVDGLDERRWAGRMLKIGGGAAYVSVARLRPRCVMTTFDPDTQGQDRSVLRRLVEEYEGSFALDCSVVQAGTVRVGDAVELRPAL